MARDTECVSTSWRHRVTHRHWPSTRRAAWQTLPGMISLLPLNTNACQISPSLCRARCGRWQSVAPGFERHWAVGCEYGTLPCPQTWWLCWSTSECLIIWLPAYPSINARSDIESIWREGHRVISLWEDDPNGNKGTNGLLTHLPTPSDLSRTHFVWHCRLSFDNLRFHTTFMLHCIVTVKIYLI